MSRRCLWTLFIVFANLAATANLSWAQECGPVRAEFASRHCQSPVISKCKCDGGVVQHGSKLQMLQKSGQLQKALLAQKSTHIQKSTHVQKCTGSCKATPAQKGSASCCVCYGGKDVKSCDPCKTGGMTGLFDRMDATLQKIFPCRQRGSCASPSKGDVACCDKYSKQGGYGSATVDDSGQYMVPAPSFEGNPFEDDDVVPVPPPAPIPDEARDGVPRMLSTGTMAHATPTLAIFPTKAWAKNADSRTASPRPPQLPKSLMSRDR